MEDPPSPVFSDDTWAEEFARTLSQQRGRAEEFLAAQRDRLDCAQAELGKQVLRISEELDRDRADTAHTRQELEQQSRQLNRQAADSARFKEEIGARQAEWEKFQKRATDHYSALAEQVRQQQEKLAARCEALQRQQAEIDDAEAKLHRDRKAFALARQEHQAEVEHVTGLRRRLEDEIAQLADDREQLATQRKHTEAQRRRIAREFRAQRAARHKELEQKPAGASRPPDAEGSDDEFRRRYAMAVEDVRELKARIAELQKELAQARTAGGPHAPASPAVGLNWEDQKRRILAALEADSDEDDEEQAAQRLTMEGVVRRTDQLIADKEREIGELKQLLENQSGNLGAVAVGAAALGEMLDKDAVIQEERENLRRLQTQWEEMLRKAEIDISLERAKIARERADIEGKLRTLEEKSSASDFAPDQARESDKPVRGRWLARLGLKNLEEE